MAKTEKISFKSRLQEVVEELESRGISKRQYALRSGITHTGLYEILESDENRNTSMRTVEKLAKGAEKIPIVFYNNEGKLEDLGIDGFLYGEVPDNYISMVLKKYREQMGLTQEGLASRAGISVSEYAKYEKGRKKPGTFILKKICPVLGLTHDYLVSPLKKIDVDALFSPPISFLENPPKLSAADVAKVSVYASQISSLAQRLAT